VGLEGTRWAHLAPPWLARFVLACAVGSGTWGGMLVVVEGGGGGEGALGLLLPLAAFAAIAIHTFRRRADVFPLAAIEASLILLSTTWIARVSDFDEIGMLFVIAAWLIVTSTVSSRYLMRLVRAWDADQPA
jgi:hypothetical protein